MNYDDAVKQFYDIPGKSRDERIINVTVTLSASLSTPSRCPRVLLPRKSKTIAIDAIQRPSGNRQVNLIVSLR